MLVGTVLGQAMVKELSPLIAAGNFKCAAPILSAGLFLCGVGSTLVVVLLSVVGESSVHLFSTQSNTTANLSLAFLVAGLGWSAQQGILILQATFAAAQRYGLLAGIGIAAAVANATSILVGSMLWPGYLGFLLGTSIGLVLSLALWVALVRYGMPNLFPLPGFRAT